MGSLFERTILRKLNHSKGFQPTLSQRGNRGNEHIIEMESVSLYNENEFMLKMYASVRNWAKLFLAYDLPLGKILDYSRIISFYFQRKCSLFTHITTISYRDRRWRRPWRRLTHISRFNTHVTGRLVGVRWFDRHSPIHRFQLLHGTYMSSTKNIVSIGYYPKPSHAWTV